MSKLIGKGGGGGCFEPFEGCANSSKALLRKRLRRSAGQIENEKF